MNIRSCPHCSSKGKLKELARAHKRINIGYAKEVGEINLDLEYGLFFCSSCEQPALYKGSIDETALQIIFPSNRDEIFIPAVVRSANIEARKVKHVSSTAYAVMARRALEILCKEQKADGGTLYSKIEDLSKKGLVPERILNIAHGIRVLGNDAAHEMEGDIRPYEAEALYELLDSLISYVYVLPEKAKHLEELVNKRKGRESSG